MRRPAERDDAATAFPASIIAQMMGARRRFRARRDSAGKSHRRGKIVAELARRISKSVNFKDENGSKIFPWIFLAIPFPALAYFTIDCRRVMVYRSFDGTRRFCAEIAFTVFRVPLIEAVAAR